VLRHVNVGIDRAWSCRLQIRGVAHCSHRDNSQVVVGAAVWMNSRNSSGAGPPVDAGKDERREWEPTEPCKGVSIEDIYIIPSANTTPNFLVPDGPAGHMDTPRKGEGRHDSQDAGIPPHGVDCGQAVSRLV
jgi:hypothetical protein